jgi:hypothetical protein
MRFGTDVFVAVKISIVGFWVMISCNHMHICRRFGGTKCFYPQGTWRQVPQKF